MVPKESLHKGMNWKVLALGIGAAIAGAFAGFFGLLIIGARRWLVMLFLGATLFAGEPYHSDDVMKVALVGLVGLAFMGVGVLLFIVGAVVPLIQFSRKT